MVTWNSRLGSPRRAVKERWGLNPVCFVLHMEGSPPFLVRLPSLSTQNLVT